MTRLQQMEDDNIVKQPKATFRVVYDDGMVNIDTPELAYANIKNMYTTGNGWGLQHDFKLDEIRYAELRDACHAVAQAVYALEEKLRTYKEKYV